MSDHVRAFIAVKIDATPPLRRILSLLGDMGRAVKVVNADQIHVTLKFLGDTDLALIPEVARVMSEVAADVPAFDAELTGLGAFPRPDRPSVIWAGLSGAEPLVGMAESLESRLRNHGFPAEHRRFVPHLTLARIKARPPRELADLLARHTATDFGTATIDAVELLQSDLTPQGPVYTRLSAVELGGV